MTARRDAGDPVDDPSAPSARLAAALFGASVVVAVPLIAFVLGDFHWFLADDWYFIADRTLGSTSDLFAPHNGHWSTVPVVAFRLLWSVFGLRTYLPYQLGSILLHVGVVVLVRVVMRRAGVGPWIASAAAGALLLYGPGASNIIWAFQIGFTGAVFFGLVQLLLSDHDGPVDRRDALALVAGTLAIASSGTGVPMVVATALALLVRRGWRRSLLHTLPLAIVYGIWSLLALGGDASAGAAPREASVAPGGLPSVGTAVRWLRNVYVAMFDGLGHHGAVVVALVAVVVVGLAVLVVTRRGTLLELLRQVALPVALAGGGVLFALLTAVTRWQLGEGLARSGRYVYLSAALSLPLIAVAAQAVARSWRATTPVLAALFLVAVPTNVSVFDDEFFGPGFHRSQEALVEAVVRVGYADEVSPEARPFTGLLYPDSLDLGFLLQAARDGRIEPSTGPIPPAIADELAVRLGLVHQTSTVPAEACRMVAAGEDLRPAKGTAYRWEGDDGAVRVGVITADGRRGRPIDIEPVEGSVLVAQREGTAFDWEPADATQPFELCEQR